MRDGSLEACWIADSGFDWEGVVMGCDAFGYSMTSGIVGRYSEGVIVHDYIY